MDKSTATSLNRRLLNNFMAGTTDTSSGEMQVSAEAFTDSEIAARERAALFMDTPQPVAFSGEIPDPGCHLALRILDIPVLLVRDTAGILRAFVNTCAHRGAQVASGSGRSSKLVCPFHGWTYQTDGTLKGRPEASMFATKPEDCSLTALPVTEKYGVVVIGCSKDVRQDAVDSALAEVGSELEEFGFSTYRSLERRQFDVQANWKLVNDLSLESYHFKTLHRDTVAQILAPNAVVDMFGRHSRWAFPLKSIARLAEIDESDWPDSVEGSVTYTLYPGVMLLVNTSGAQMIRSEPGRTPDSSTVTYVGMKNPGSDFDEAFGAFQFGGDVFANEDLPVAEECQRGLPARGGSYLLGANEPLLQFWHRLWNCSNS